MSVRRLDELTMLCTEDYVLACFLTAPSPCVNPNGKPVSPQTIPSRISFLVHVLERT